MTTDGGSVGAEDGPGSVLPAPSGSPVAVVALGAGSGAVGRDEEDPGCCSTPVLTLGSAAGAVLLLASPGEAAAGAEVLVVSTGNGDVDPVFTIDAPVVVSHPTTRASTPITPRDLRDSVGMGWAWCDAGVAQNTIRERLNTSSH